VQQVDGHAPPIEEYDPNPVPGQPPRGMAANGNGGPPGMAQRVAPHLRRERDPNAPPEGRETAVSRADGAMPERGFPKRIMWVPLPDIYQDCHIRAWVNYPNKIIDDVQTELRKIRSPDDYRVNPDALEIDPEDFGIDPEAYGLSDSERQERLDERERRTKERERRRVEKARRQEAYDAAYAKYARVMGEIILEHDIHDLAGELLPPADTTAFWDYMAGEMLTIVMEAITGQQGKLNPKSARH
jgi:hypothetical protein